MITAQQLLCQRQQPIWSIEKGSTVYDAIKEMEKRGVGALLVMEDERLIGIISERDYTRKIVLMDRSSKTTLVKEIMSTNVISVQQNESMNECMRQMYDHAIRHLPVLEGNTVVGMLSIKDVLGGLLSEKEDLIHQLENYIHS